MKETSMAGTGSDSQKHLLSLIRNFAAEKSHGERRVTTLKKRIEELKSELSATNAELEVAKRGKELVEQELKGYEVQLFLSEASVQTLESRVSLIQDEISTVGSHLEIIKNEEAALREEFIGRMLELNARIRKFQESITGNIDAVDSATPTDTPRGIIKGDDTKGALSALENMLTEITSQTAKEEEEYKSEQNIHKNVLQELNNSERKLSLLDNIIEETKALHDLTMQTSKLEAAYSSLGEEFQRRCMCPNCHADISETVSELLQPNK
ncbi:uncharacterized protein LOC129306213 isoform X1 [Prosopis cineraria]|uniref:uncharacterized protein LOC129306213 isoform X1 n=1 Tax=Prosopis cineraria TaxID=364024 RepID=UPI002410AE10|nr:uncharacterized protein LOC129306213 isoform X1 [Prosopis cineraria]